MEVAYEGGILVREGARVLWLDPERARSGSIVSHGHLDHLTSGGYMTEPTLDILKVRRRDGHGVPLPLDAPTDVDGFQVTLRDAGHTFGSAMVRVDDLLYTGDFSTEGGLTCGRAEPEWCQTLVIEATYGHPSFRFPKKKDVEADLLAWTESQLANGPVAIGAYEFGKAQEIVAILNRGKVDVAVSDRIASFADVYRRHGVKLSFRRASELEEDEQKEPRAYVVPQRWIRSPPKEAPWIKDAKTAYASGWCNVYDFTRSYGLDAQFPLSDHADFEHLLRFTEHCRPRRVYTVFTHASGLAKEIDRRLRIRAEPLRTVTRQENEVFG